MFLIVDEIYFQIIGIVSKVGLPKARQRAGRPGPEIFERGRKTRPGPEKLNPSLCRVLVGYINCQVDFFNLSNKLGKNRIILFLRIWVGSNVDQEEQNIL